MASSNGNIFRDTGPLCGELTGEFPAQRPVTRSFDVFFHLCLNKRLSKQSLGWSIETPSCSLWPYYNGYYFFPENEIRVLTHWSLTKINQSWNILTDSPVGILWSIDYKYYMTFITTIGIYLMLFHHFYNTWFYCIYCILYLEQVFIAYIVLHTVNRSGIDLNKADYHYYKKHFLKWKCSIMQLTIFKSYSWIELYTFYITTHHMIPLSIEMTTGYQ